MTHKRSFQRRRPKVKKTDFGACPTSVGAPPNSREIHGGLPTQKRRRPKQPPLAGKITPIGGEGTSEAESLSEVREPPTLAALHKTSQRGLLAYQYTYPVPVGSSQGHKLGNRLQPCVVAGAGGTSRGRVPRRCRRAQARKLTLRIETQRHFRILASRIPGRALHDKVLPRQIGDGPLVSSQDQRALLVLRINCSRTCLA